MGGVTIHHAFPKIYRLNQGTSALPASLNCPERGCSIPGVNLYEYQPCNGRFSSLMATLIEFAAADLRAAGVPDSALSVIARQDASMAILAMPRPMTSIARAKACSRVPSPAVASARCSASPRSPFPALARWSRQVPSHHGDPQRGGDRCRRRCGCRRPCRPAHRAWRQRRGCQLLRRAHPRRRRVPLGDTDEAGLGADQLRDILSRNGGRSSASATTDATATTY